jgi:hypothetical protein
MNYLFAAALSTSLVAMQCSNQANGGSPPSQCAADSASLARTARASLGTLGLPSPNAEVALEVTQRPIRIAGSERLAVTVSWGGPSNGAILWADCSGRILDGEASGYALAVEPIPVEPGRMLIRLRALTGTGSGWRQESIHLYAPHADSLTLVWSGVIAERSHQAAAVGAYEEEGELTYITADSLVHSSTRFPVSMSGDGSWRRDVEHAERTIATYHWNSDVQRYDLLRPAAVPARGPS